MKNPMSESISNLEAVSKALRQVANHPQNYNIEFSHTLEKMSWDLYRQAEELRLNQFLYSVTF